MTTKLIDLTGQRFGKWTVLSKAPSRGGVRWQCRCDCGTEAVVYSMGLRNGRSQSCGCSQFSDLTNHRFGRLTALSLSGERNREGQLLWLCRCDCGTEPVVSGASMRSGQTKSCGCLRNEKTKNGDNRRTHSDARSKFGPEAPEYRAWRSMKGRCYNPKQQSYRLYGAVGIRVCDEWHDYETFLRDMGRKPTPQHTLGRIDSTKDYGPDNCRWETAKQQSRNTNRNHYVEYRGRTMSLAEACEIAGARYLTVFHRLKRGWDLDRALTTPKMS